MSTTDVFITPTIIRQALRKLKPGKGDGDRGFKSDHLLHSTHRFHVLLCLLFNTMLVHGYTPDDLLQWRIQGGGARGPGPPPPLEMLKV